jgi:hypothetical protein
MDVQEYTERKLGEQMMAAEIHLTDFLQGERDSIGNFIGEDFCVECLAKHALAISEFSQEGTQFFNADPYFRRTYEEGLALYNDLPDFDDSKAKKHYDEIRKLRKELVAKHLLIGINTISTTNSSNANHFSGKHMGGGLK